MKKVTKKAMKKMFSRETVMVIVITYMLMGLVFIIGYSLPTGSGFISFPRSFGGIVLSMMAFPHVPRI